MRSPLPKRRRDEILYAALALCSGAILCVWGALDPAQAQQPAAEPAPAAAPLPPGVAAPAVAPVPEALPDKIRIVFSTVPSAKAMVYWGKKRLGLIEPKRPLVVQRPRDSGPMDLMVRAEGFLPVQTRVYTFADGKIAVKLTPPDKKNTLLGYREPPPPDAGSSLSGITTPDGGAADTGPPPP